MFEIKPLNYLSTYLEKLLEGKLWLKVIVGLLLGTGLGLLLNPNTDLVNESLSHNIANWLDLPGQLFMRLVQMVMIPLVFTSIISGIVSNTSDNLKTFGVRLLLYFLFTTFVAVFIGLIVTLLMNPGRFIFDMGGFPNAGPNTITAVQKSNFMENIPQAISSLIPVNPLETLLTGEMMGVIVFTLIIGVALTQIEKEQAAAILKLSEAIQKICMIVVSWAMRLVPIAVFGLMAALLSKIGIEILLALGYYMLVVIIGLFILLLFYGLLVFFIGKISPIHFFKKIKEPQLLAFSTASSAAVMPLSMKTADEELGVSSKVSDFVVPIGATINMDGTALFQCVTTIFMIQAYGIDLSLINMVIISLTVAAASVGTPAIPGGGVIILATVLQGAGIPVDGLVVIIGLDRILGMFRTAVNVTGDLTASVIFNRFYGK